MKQLAKNMEFLELVITKFEFVQAEILKVMS